MSPITGLLPGRPVRYTETRALPTLERFLRALPGVPIVLDPFHLVRGANGALDTVRRERQRFRAIYRARAEAERRLRAFEAAVERAAIPSFTAFANGLRSWREELLAYFDQPTTNGYAEGVINKIKVIKRRAHGLPSFDSFRTRILVTCG